MQTIGANAFTKSKLAAIGETSARIMVHRSGIDFGKIALGSRSIIGDAAVRMATAMVGGKRDCGIKIIDDGNG